MIALIPLKFLHDFFAQLDFPIQNTGLKITFNIAGTSNFAGYCPFTCPSFAAHRTLGQLDASTGVTVAAADVAGIAAATLAPAVTPAAKPTVTIAVTGQEKNTGWSTKPSLWLKTVTYTAKVAAEVSALISAGYKRKIVYSVSQIMPSVQASSNIDQPISQGLTRPVRMWAFALPTGTLASEKNSFPAYIGPYAMKNVQVHIAGDPNYREPVRSQMDLYREFRSQTIGSGSSTTMATPISYSDWLLGMNPYCIDISRNPLVKANQSVALQFAAEAYTHVDGQPVAGAFDLVVVVERLCTCVIDVSAGGVTMLSSDGAD